MPAHWDHTPRDWERMQIHASPQSLAADIKQAQTEYRRIGRIITRLEALHDKRAAEKAAGVWPYVKDPRAVESPCGKSHVCVTCSPAPDVPGRGCPNCRATGYDQTPCVACDAKTEARAT